MSNGMNNASGPARVRLDGLDALRGLCALAVVLGHVNLPELGYGAVGKILAFLFQVVSNGPAAVVVFFVVSGLCIHLPQAGGRRLSVPVFYARRSIRIGIPMVAGFLLAFATGAVSEYSGVLWSLIAELVYYAIYPLLLASAKRVGWHVVLAASCLAALGLLMTDPGAAEYPRFGWGLTWILGLPVWILGCILAESLHRPRPANPTRAWILRFAMLGASALAIVARWHLGQRSVGFPWTLSVFGVVAWLWLGQELAQFRSRPPMAWMDRLGAASYSLYLAHVSFIHLAWVHAGQGREANLAFRVALVLLALGGGWLFYLAIERPSHLLAKAIGRQRL